jgi:hypothetical protein
MLEARVARLEEDVREIRSVLSRLEPMIVGLVRSTPKTADLTRVEERLAETREEMKEIKGEVKGLLPTRTFVLWMLGFFVALAGLFINTAG